MRALACLLPLLLSAAPAPTSTDVLARDAETRWVDFELTPANQIRFAMTVDGRPVTAILDTGVSSSILSRGLADRMKLRVQPGTVATAIGGTVASGWVDLENLTFGALTRHRARLATAALPDAATGGMPVDLLVGRDLTEAIALDIDYDARRFRLLPSGRLPFGGSIAPLRISGTWPSYVTAVSIGDRRVARMVVDTGDGSAVTLTGRVWRSLAEAYGKTTTTIGYGIGGATVVDLAIVPALHIGTLAPQATEVRIEGSGGYSEAIGMNGRVGSGFLAGYRVLLDPAAGRMVLRPGNAADAPPVRSTSGLVLRRDGDRLTVVHVMRGGPAEGAGWRAGEQICRVDGNIVDRGDTLGWPVGPAGRTVRLGLCDGSERPLTLRAFY